MYFKFLIYYLLVIFNVLFLVDYVIAKEFKISSNIESVGLLHFSDVIKFLNHYKAKDGDDKLILKFEDGIYKTNGELSLNLDARKLNVKTIEIIGSVDTIFDGAVDISGYNWVQNERFKDIWMCRINSALDIYGMWINGLWGTRKFPDKNSEGLDIEFDLSLLRSPGEFAWNNGVLYLFSKKMPAQEYKTIEVPINSNFAVKLSNFQKITIQKVKFQNYYYESKTDKIFQSANIVLDNFKNALIEKCSFSQSFASIIASSINMDGKIEVRDCDFFNNYCHYYAREEDQDNNWLLRLYCAESNINNNFIDGNVSIYNRGELVKNTAFGIVVQQLDCFPEILKVNIYKNKIVNMGRTGIGLFDSTKNGVAKHVEFKIFDNYIYNGLTGYSKKYKKSIDCDAIGVGGSVNHKNYSWSGVKIFRNVIEKYGHTGIHLANKQGNNFDIYDNIIIGVPQEKTGFAAIRVNNGATVRNNLIYKTFFGFAIAEANESMNNIIKDNVIIYKEKSGRGPVRTVNLNSIVTSNEVFLYDDLSLTDYDSLNNFNVIYTDVTGNKLDVDQYEF